MRVNIDEHALVRGRERGATEEEMRIAVESGECFPAKRGRTGFRKNFAFKSEWMGKYYENKQLEVFAAKADNGWTVITVIVKYF